MTMWEVYTFGTVPYQEYGVEKAAHAIVNGERLPQPMFCPDAMFRLMNLVRASIIYFMMYNTSFE